MNCAIVSFEKCLAVVIIQIRISFKPIKQEIITSLRLVVRGIENACALTTCFAVDNEAILQETGRSIAT